MSNQKRRLINQAILGIATTFSLFSASVANAASLQANNLVFNGDFSAGNTGFSSDYQDQYGGEGNIEHPPFLYTIGTNARNHHRFFGSFNDHTSGDGLMMIVNGGSFEQGVGPKVWSQTIDVNRNTDYDLSAWAATTFPNAPAQLQFAINSEVIGSELNLSTITNGFWQNLKASWNSGDKEFVTLSIINHNQIWHGNDFILDDISMISVGSSSTPEIESVPEPTSTVAIVGLGAIALFRYKRRS